MEVETLAEWMLRRREELVRNAATHGVVKHTMEYLKRRLQHAYRMHYGRSPHPKIILRPDSVKNSNATCDFEN